MRTLCTCSMHGKRYYVRAVDAMRYGIAAAAGHAHEYVYIRIRMHVHVHIHACAYTCMRMLMSYTRIRSTYEYACV